MDFTNPIISAAITKGIRDVEWGSPVAASGSAQISVNAAQAMDKSLHPTDSYSLVPAVNTAVQARSQNVAKAKVRLFTRNGDEILDGELHSLLRRPHPSIGQREFIEEICSWFDIAGEWCAYMSPGITSRITSILPLNPYRINHTVPMRPRSRMHVQQWIYTFDDDTQDQVPIDDQYMLFDAQFNPADSIRGLSPLVVAGVVSSTTYYANRYNKSFHENYCVPSHIISLPAGTPKTQRESFERRYLDLYQAYRGNAFKAMVVSGGDIKIEKLDQEAKDGQFLELCKYYDEKIGQIYRVPPIEMFNLQKTRFDTAKEERQMFAESTLMPLMERLSEVLQTQLVDRFYNDSPRSLSRKDASFGPMCTKAFESALEKRASSNVIVMLDPDTLPIMNQVMLAKAEQAKVLREAFNMSAYEAGQFIGMELKKTKENSDVWIPAGQVNITDLEMNAKINPGMTGEGTAESKDESGKPTRTKSPDKSPDKPAEEPAKVLTPEQKSEVAKIEKFYRRLRAFTFQHLDGGEVWSVEAACELAKGFSDHIDRRHILSLRHGIRHAMKGRDKDAAKTEIRAFLNALDPRQLVTG